MATLGEVLGLRKTQKEATRRRVLDAARQLFESQGYEETTVRAIARAAGVAVGSVFTSIASKGEILSLVMQERLEGLYAELDRVIPHLRASTADRLRSMFAIHYAYEEPRKRLFLAHIAATYDWRLGPAAKPYGHNARLRQVVHDCINEGVVRGDVDPATDIGAVVELLIAAYAWNFRLAAWEDADAKTMSAAMDRLIGQIAESFRPRGGVNPAL